MNAPSEQVDRLHLPLVGVAAVTLLLEGVPLSVSPVQGEAVPWQERVAAGIEKTLASERPKWKPEDRTKFAREVAAHFVDVTPAEALPRRAQAFLDAFAESVQTTHGELLTPSMLPHDIAELKWRIDLWTRRGDVNRAEEDAIVRQLREIFEWGGAEIRTAKPRLGPEQVNEALQDRAQEAEKLCRNPLSVAYHVALTGEQVQEVKERFRKRLRETGPPAGRRPNGQAAWCVGSLASAIASAAPVSRPRTLRELGRQVSVEREERLNQEEERLDAEMSTKALSRSADSSEPFEWLGCFAAQLLGALAGEDPWPVGLW